MKSLIPPPQVTETPGEVTEDTSGEEISEAKKKEEEKYNLYRRVYAGLLSKEEESDTDTDGLTYTYFT